MTKPKKSNWTSATKEDEARIRKDFPLYFRIQERYYPVKKPDPSEKEILERIEEEIIKVKISIKKAKELRATRYILIK